LDEQLTIEAFQKNFHSKFRVVRPGAPQVMLDLVDIKIELCPPPQEQFSVFFTAPAACGLGQGNFRMQHEQMGEFDLFIVPIGTDGQEIRYQAVFNRLRKPSGSSTGNSALRTG